MAVSGSWLYQTSSMEYLQNVCFFYSHLVFLRALDLIYHFLALFSCVALVAQAAFFEAPARAARKGGEIRVRWQPVFAGSPSPARWDNLR